MISLPRVVQALRRGCARTDKIIPNGLSVVCYKETMPQTE